MEIGQVIRALRQKRGETLESMALDIGTDASNLSRIERGIQQPSTGLLRAIATALQTTIAELHACAEGKSYSPEQAQELLGGDESDFTNEAIQLRQCFRTLSPDNQRALLEIAKVLNRLQRNS